ncbi:MAG: membrane protein insertion efficiency factor YidD [Candidatus Makaraimicrobium thalassicum]|nr:MAG: membrane protein insertion efficiency factor YidD [Candidatus Omnitrophota bacterium]
MKKALIALIKGYKKFVSPCFAKSCRFAPTCSEYAIEALGKFGVFRGTALSVWRILRCNPFSRGGFDPVIKE